MNQAKIKQPQKSIQHMQVTLSMKCRKELTLVKSPERVTASQESEHLTTTVIPTAVTVTLL